MTKAAVLVAGVLLWAGWLGESTCSEGKVVARFGFEASLPLGCFSLDPEAVLQITHEAGRVRQGSGALEFLYTPREGVLPGFILTGLKIPGARSVEFWIRSSHYTGVAVILAEKDGSRYVSYFLLGPGKWQKVALSLDEFLLEEKSQDENWRLDPDQIRAMGILDLVVFKPLREVLKEEATGTRYLGLDEVVFSTKEVPRSFSIRPVEGGKEVVVDCFENGLVQWLPVGLKCPRPEVKWVREGAEGRGALRMDYSLEPKGAVALVKPLEGLPLKGAERVSLRIRVAQPSAILIALEEQDGSNYQYMLKVLPEEGWKKVEAPLVQFKLAKDSTDENSKLDTDQLKLLILLDASAFMGRTGPRTLWVDEVAFLCRSQSKP